MIITPEVSVIIPTYNRSSMVQLAIKSVQEQTFSDLEIIVIDDGSNDNTQEVISQFQKSDNRIVYLYQNNQGPSVSRNTGIKSSHGKYISFLDSDDLWKPDKIEKQLSIFKQHEDIDVVYVNYINIDNSGDFISYNLSSEADNKFKSFSLYEKLFYFCAVTGSDSSVIAKRDAIIRTGFFDEHLYVSEDRDYWRRMAISCNFYFLDEYLVLIRRHKNSQTGDINRAWESDQQYLIKLYNEVPTYYRFHLPEVSYQMYKDYLLKFLSEHTCRGFFIALYIFGKIANVDKKYVFRLFNGFLLACKRNVRNARHLP